MPKPSSAWSSSVASRAPARPRRCAASSRRRSTNGAGSSPSATSSASELAPGPQIDLAAIAVARGRHGLGPPRAVYLRPQVRRPRFAVPADLLHAIVELQRMSVRVDGERAIVDAREELGRQVADAHSRSLQKRQRVAQLAVVRELQPERHQGGAFVQPERGAQGARVQRQRVVLGVDAQESATLPVVAHLLGKREAQLVAIEAQGRLHVAHEKPHRTDAHQDRKSTRLNSSHSQISYAVFCLKKKKQKTKNI